VLLLSRMVYTDSVLVPKAQGRSAELELRRFVRGPVDMYSNHAHAIHHRLPR